MWYPRKVAVIRTSGKYVVCDRGSERSRMQLFTKTGQFIKKIGIRYIDIVAGLAISSQGWLLFSVNYFFMIYEIEKQATLIILNDRCGSVITADCSCTRRLSC